MAQNKVIFVIGFIKPFSSQMCNQPCCYVYNFIKIASELSSVMYHGIRWAGESSENILNGTKKGLLVNFKWYSETGKGFPHAACPYIKFTNKSFLVPYRIFSDASSRPSLLHYT
ncbi:unnamed protein product [Meganyctiphanes norvegica]|uniref:Uncharacterized protein n=1 Tax=Meganyctiphanes norvegica TaxID=48144 RepID=A0AAV2RCY6_MEGNR